MKNIDELYKKYYNVYKSDYGTDDELNETKKKKFDHNQFKLVDKTDKELKLDEETRLKTFLGNRKVFNDLEKLINDISNNNVKKEGAIKRMKKSVSDLEQLRQKESTVFQNIMIYLLYYLFNSFGLGEKPLLFNEKKTSSIKTIKICRNEQIE